ncbi:MAG: rhodanese-like domain-containing protein [Opitutaceae bacterium]|jgi:rhodanese-related sulfurtransferase
MKKLVLTLATSCLLFVSAAFAGSPKYADISLPDLKAAIASGKVAVIDVNGTDSFKSGHIPGAIDFEANEAKLASLLPADKSTLVVAYCGNPQCGAYKQGASAAEKLGYTNVKHFALGIQGWKKAGENAEK